MIVPSDQSPSSPSTRVRFGVLGPLEVLRGNEIVDIGGPQQKALLAIFLLHANQVVSTGRLIDHLWGPRPPATARSLLQGCVSQLRRVLRSDEAQPLETRPPGYLLRVQAGELDLLRFEGIVQAASDMDAGRRSSLLADALALWRGPVLDGLNLPGCHDVIAELDERRAAVLEQKIETDLRHGAKTALVVQLKAELRSHPLREHLWGLLIAALYALGRQADALSCYRELRESLIEQLGVEPSLALQELHRQVLAGVEPSELVIPVGTDPPRDSMPAIPAHLPPAPVTFVGRSQDMRRLDTLLTTTSSAPVVGVVSGTAGVGKTALVLHWAHEVRDVFPAGQLYVNLRGYGTSPPMDPLEALAGFLVALGLPPDRVPTDVEQAAALYRSVLSGKRVLIVLDNAVSVAQVRPLLPATVGCRVVVTCRGWLDGLVARDDARLITLDVLGIGDASSLLTRLVGDQRIDAEPDAARELVGLCGYLPLALRITAANLIRHPRRSLADQAEALRLNALDALVVGGDEETAVRAVFDQSYATLGPVARRLFGLLGLIPGPTFDISAAGVMTGIPLTIAAASLATLVGAHLVEEPEHGRFALHDLLRLFAREKVDEADERASVRRYRQWLLELTDDATRVLCPQVLRLLPGASSMRRHENAESALSWLDVERHNLLAVTVHAAAADDRKDRQLACRLADALRGYYWLRRDCVDWLTVANAARAAADGDFRAQAAAEFSLGMAKLCLNRYDEVLGHQRRALELCEAATWDEGRANALANLGVVHFELGELELATDFHERALEINLQVGSRRGEAVNHENLAQVDLAAGRLPQAAGRLWRAISLHQEAGQIHGKAVSLEQLGVMHWRQGEFGHAETALNQAVGLNRTTGNVNGQAMSLGALAVLLSRAGRPDDALRAAVEGQELVRRTQDRVTEAIVLHRLGTAQHASGRYADALDAHTRSLSLGRQTGARMPQIEALVGLALAQLARGSADRALDHAGEARRLAETGGFQILLGQALVASAAAQGAGGEARLQAMYARKALEIAAQTGDMLIRRDATTLLNGPAGPGGLPVISRSRTV